MARYRKIDPRIWNDEMFVGFDPFQKLAWFGLLTHPLMTPMGAASFPASLVDHMIGNRFGWCFRCEHDRHPDPDDVGCAQVEHSGEGILEGFRERSAILRDRDLVIVRNYLVYNRPDNPNQLAGWIECCEELPRSEAFKVLVEHLAAVLEGQPTWLFTGLLEPLAAGQRRNLKADFWRRVEQSGVASNPPEMVGGKVRGRVAGKVKGRGRGSTPPNQEQEQEQEQEYRTLPPTVPPTALANGSRPRSRSALAASASNTAFDHFWRIYPRKKGKGAALKAWRQLNPGAEGIGAILDAVEDQRRWPEWQRDGGAFIPYPATWLHQRRWEDERDPAPVAFAGRTAGNAAAIEAFLKGGVK